MKKIRTRSWVLLTALVLALGVGGLLAVRLLHGGGTTAEIYAQGELLYTIDLANVSSPFELEIETAAGHNTVSVEPGRIRVRQADCPDQICVETGWLTEGGRQIVCLPHQLVIQIVDRPGEADAFSR